MSTIGDCEYRQRYNLMASLCLLMREIFSLPARHKERERKFNELKVFFLRTLNHP